MDFETVKTKFGSWADKFRCFIESPAFDDIFKHIRTAAGRGRTISPESSQTFRAFQLTPYDSLKAVLFFAGPYADRIGDIKVADGLGLSASNTKRLTTPLEKFYRGLEQDISGGLNLDMVDEPDLSYLAEQGILLLNTALTVELEKPGSHQDLWRPFMEYFINEVLNTYERCVPVVFFGKQPAGYSKLVYPFNHWVFETQDLMSMRADEVWDTAGMFRNLNEIILQSNKGIAPPAWFKENAKPSP